MNTDDFIYLLFLLLSIFFGIYYRKIESPQIKQKIGALFGLLIVIAVSKLHTVHIILTILFNSFIILYLDKRYCHLISFTFSFAYLIFFRTTEHYGIPYPPSHTNLIQMILTLKLVGLSFEVNSAYSDKKEDFNNLTISDIFFYGINYIGVLTGPYFKYKTYHDHLYKPFHKYDDFKTETVKRVLPWVPIFVIVFLYTEYVWPINYIQSSEFEGRSFLYRYWYIWPRFLNFRMRIYIGLLLSECVCIMSGLGVYPSFANNKPGSGPTSEIYMVERLSDKKEVLKAANYDYETVRNITPYSTEFCPTLREGMKNWNMTVQYWLAACIYKRFPNKKLRTSATMLVSGIWHGVYAGYFISVGMIPFGLLVEDIWAQLLLDDFLMPRKLGYVIMLFLKMQFFSYAALAFSLLDVKKVMHYYGLVYHWMIFYLITMYFFGKYLLRLKERNAINL